MWIAVFFILVTGHDKVFQPWDHYFDNKHACERIVKSETNALNMAIGYDPNKVVEGQCIYISDQRKL